MALLTSRNANKHVLLALGVNRTARDTVKAKFTRVPTHRLASYTTVSCNTRSVHVSSLHKSSITKPRKASSKCCTKVCILLYDSTGISTATDV